MVPRRTDRTGIHQSVDGAVLRRIVSSGAVGRRVAEQGRTMTTTGPTPTPTTTPHTTAGTRERVQYLVVGLVIGALWIAHRNEPLWEDAARTLVVLVAVPLLAAPAIAVLGPLYHHLLVTDHPRC